MTLQDFDPAVRFVAGTVGAAGQRAFYLQASDDMRLITVGLEKQQVALLAERILEVLDRLIADSPAAGAVSPGVEDTAPLHTPFDEDWKVQTLALSWDDERGVLVIECHDHQPDEIEESTDPALPDPGASPEAAFDRNSLRVVLEPEQARSFALRCAALVAAGRPPCPFCGGPLDATGHVCPRANGHRR
ncbi:MAG: DUF3090 domain-containing protein [Dermatophilaceae bacterium]